MYKNMDKDDKKQIESMISQLATLATNTLKNEISSTFIPPKSRLNKAK